MAKNQKLQHYNARRSSGGKHTIEVIRTETHNKAAVTNPSGGQAYAGGKCFGLRFVDLQENSNQKS